MPVDLTGGTVPTVYRQVFEMFNSHGLNKLTFTVFVLLFESNTLTKTLLNQVWYVVTKTDSIGSRNDLYKCLALMALAQQGKTIDEKLLDNYTNRELPTPTIDNINTLEDRLIRLLQSSREKSTLCFRYNDLCALDTIQVDLVPGKKGVILRHVEYQVTSSRQQTQILRRYRDFFALHEILLSKYPFRLVPPLPRKKTVNGLSAALAHSFAFDKEFIEERRRALKRYLQSLCRHPVIHQTDVIKFFLTYQGASCSENIKATYKNTPDEFQAERRVSLNPMENVEKNDEDANGIEKFHQSQTHMSFIHQYLSQIRNSLKSINEKCQKNAEDFSNMEKNFDTLATDPTTIDRWATGPNDYWPRIQVGLTELPVEIKSLSTRLDEQCQRNDEIINDQLESLIELLQGYKDLCKRFEEALQNEQKATQKVNNQQRRSAANTPEISTKNDTNLDSLVKQNKHALNCVKLETQLVYANFEAFVSILNSLGSSQSKGTSDICSIWKTFAKKIAQLGEDYVNKTTKQRK